MCISILYKYHKEWVSIVRKFGERNYAEDIVQETYIKIFTSKACEKAIINNEVNRAFIWIALKNNYISYYKEKQRAEKVGIEHINNLSTPAEETDKHKTIDKIEIYVLQEIDSWHWYDKKLWEVYVYECKSMRKLNKETGISLSSIANTIKSCKQRIKENCGEHYEDYLNEDYDKI